MFPERFLAKIRIDESGCWIWTAGRNKLGYGRFGLPGQYKTVQAHRFAYEQFYGPIPEGMFVCHHCDNPPCVNPEHLFVGTHVDNMKDMWSKGRGFNKNKLKTHCHRGHAFDEDNTYAYQGYGRRCKACHREINREFMRKQKRSRKTSDYETP